MTEIDRFRAGTVYTDVQLRRGEAIFTAYEEAQQAAADAPASEVADIEPLVMTGLQVTGETPADAFQALADALRRHPDLVPDLVAVDKKVLAEEPGVDGSAQLIWEYRVKAIRAVGDDGSHEAVT
ncbi:hypothetical protein [Streptacidiphilus monticola]|uniref:Uncharacterized protein n=1 Tax=Streptacidiphilus monticola TaxID=2161674 RepID=A0ABW1GE56_9ACTN